MVRFCNKCEKAIIFSRTVMSRTGKFIPLDVETGEPHMCKERFIVECRKCGKEITFENNFRNPKNGKCIPLNAYDGETHKCKSSSRTGLDEFI